MSEITKPRPTLQSRLEAAAALHLWSRRFLTIGLGSLALAFAAAAGSSPHLWSTVFLKPQSSIEVGVLLLGISIVFLAAAALTTMRAMSLTRKDD